MPLDFAKPNAGAGFKGVGPKVGSIPARKPAVVLGTGFTATCKAIMPLVDEKGPFTYCITPGVQPKPGSFVFSANISTHDLAPVNLRFFHQKGWNRVAIITSTDATGQDFEEGFNESLVRPEFKGITIVARKHFNTTDISVSAQMARIKSANPQVVVLWATGSGFGTLLRGYHDVGLDIPAAGGIGNLIYAQLEQLKAFVPKDLYFAAPPAVAERGATSGPVAEAQKPYYAAFRAARTRTDIPSTMAWDPAMLLIEALQKLGPDASAEQVRAYLSGLHHWVGVNGVYDFQKYPQRGLGEENAVMLRYDATIDDVSTVSKPGGRL